MRVKGSQTVGSLCDEVVTEKNEITPWCYYDPDTLYAGVAPGRDLTSSFTSVGMNGHNIAQSYSLVTSTTPPKSVVLNSESSFAVDFQINGEDQGSWVINYTLPIWQTGGGYRQDLDPSIRVMPFDIDLLSTGLANGCEIPVMLHGASFSPQGMADRYYNIRVPQAYRSTSSVYPLVDGNPEIAQASGFINNYTTAGGLSTPTLFWLQVQNFNFSLFSEPYLDVVLVNDRGAASAANLTAPAQLSEIPVGSILFSHIHTLQLVYTPEPL